MTAQVPYRMLELATRARLHMTSGDDLSVRQLMVREAGALQQGNRLTYLADLLPAAGAPADR